MTPAETATLLATMAAYDYRKVGDVDVHAWHAILGRYEDGPREDVLLRAPGSAGVLEEVAERCRARLAALADVPDDLYAVAGELAAPEDAAHQVLLGEEREEQIRLDAALVKLIEDDRVGRAQERAITEHDAGVAKTMRVSFDITRSSRTT